ncbi:MAG: hypothetical protein AAF748_14725 [Pseudomonadota bacterium]
MRALTHCDAVCAARAIYLLEPDAQEAALLRMARAASWAARFRRRFRRPHPYWGDGSLMTVALAGNPPPEPRLSDPRYCRALALVLGTLAAYGVGMRAPQ